MIDIYEEKISLKGKFMTKALLYLAALTFILSGCVSTGTHEAALKESQERLERAETLSAELEDARQTNAGLKAEVEALTSRLDALKAAMNEDLSAMNAHLDRAEAENQDLRTRVEEKDAAISTLRTELMNIRQENDFLTREVERLRAKAGELSAEKEAEVKGLRETYDKLVKEMEGEIEKGEIKITSALDKLSVNFVEKILFDSGRAEIKPRGLEILKRVGDILKEATDKQIRVEGHTDNVPIGPKIKDRFPTNWELSAARATNVVRYLQEKVGLDPALLSVAGYSQYRPVADNDTYEGRAENRRIEIVLLPLDVDRVLEELKK